MVLPVTEKEGELRKIIMTWCEKRGLEREDALAIGICCRGDEASQKMIDFLRENPDIEYTALLQKAVEISDTVKND